MQVTIIGCGVMGGAFARHLGKKGYALTLCDRNQEKGRLLAKEIQATFIEDPSKAAKGSEILILAIKPKDLEQLADRMGKLEGKILLSMLMGVSLDSLKRHFPGSSIVRSMPNLALKYGQSVIALSEGTLRNQQVREVIDRLLEGLGLVFWTEEEKIDPITALAGSGPAFIIAVIEAMVESGIAMGLKASESQEISLQTVRGALALIEGNGTHPGSVRWDICAPGGSTIAGMIALEQSSVRAGIMNTFLAAYERVRRKL